MKQKALITGITGQDGAYLSRFLLSKDYEVYGAVRRASTKNTWRLKALGIEDRIKFVDFELLEYTNIDRVLKSIAPHEIYNLAAQSFVGVSFEQPIFTSEVDALGVTRILETIRHSLPEAKFYQASTSEMFGKAQAVPQTEQTPFYPRSPYGVAKLYSHWMTVNYRESYDIYTCSGILFNHESPLRGREFVTRKITSSLALIEAGKLDKFSLGNMDAKRDWGYAADYVEGMWRMLQQDKADDYVLATGEAYTVRHFVDCAAKAFGFETEWSGTGIDEICINKLTGKVIVDVDPRHLRPAEVESLIGDSTKAEQKLGWKRKVQFEQLVTKMVEADVTNVNNL